MTADHRPNGRTVVVTTEAQYARQQADTAAWIDHLTRLSELGIIPVPPSNMRRVVDFSGVEAVAVAVDAPSSTDASVAEVTAIAPPQLPDPTGVHDLSDLITLSLPPLRWLIEGLVPEGLIVLSAPPKIGKSRLVYQIAVEMAAGGAVLGRNVERGAVLYLALEDGARRVQERTLQALSGRPLPREWLYATMHAQLMGAGLEQMITTWIEGRRAAGVEPRLVAIDTLQKVRPVSSGRRNAYEVDVEDVSRLHLLCVQHGVSLLIVHHDKKGPEADFLARVSGTYGIAGSADTIMVLERGRGQDYGKLHVTGRDCPDAEVGIRFDGALGWQIAPEGVAAMASPQRRAVYEYLSGNGPAWPKDVASALGLTRPSVHRMIASMREDGIIEVSHNGYTVTEDNEMAISTVTH